MEAFDVLREANRENFHRIWEAAKEGRALSREEKRFADAMRAHPEHHNTWEFSDVVGPAPYEIDGVNPFMHIVAHVIIETQLDEGSPPEAAKALERLRGNGMDRHQAVHQIAGLMFELMFPILKEGKAFDSERYRKRLRRLGR